MTSVEEFAHGFGEEPGYLDYGRVGPISQAVRVEASAQYELLARARDEASRPRCRLPRLTTWPHGIGRESRQCGWSPKSDGSSAQPVS